LLSETFPEEPDALIGHVRVCGGSGWVTARFYPAKEDRFRGQLKENTSKKEEKRGSE
jgi:hypothetical protein